MDRDACLLVNPAAGGGKAARVLPDVEAELRRLGVAFRTEQTTSLLHATELARAAAERGEAIVTLSGDGLIGSVVGTLKQVDGALLGVLPGGRGNDLARVLGIPLEAVPACEVIAPGAELDDGLFDVVMCSDIGKLRFLRLLTKVFKGTHIHEPFIEVRRSASVRIAADRPFTVYADGDPIGDLPLTMRVVPHALDVLCPS